jgi:hypothetical protein
MDVRNDVDLQAIQTSVAFKNISDAVEQYRRQFGLAFLALVAFSAIHVGLVVIANLYTMQTRVTDGALTSTSSAGAATPVGTASVTKQYDLSYIMTNMDETSQVHALNHMKSISFVDKSDNYRQYTVTGFQLGGWKRSELKLYTAVGHVLEYVRGKGVRVFAESGSTSSGCNCTGTTSRRQMLARHNEAIGASGLGDADDGERSANFRQEYNRGCSALSEGTCGYDAPWVTTNFDAGTGHDGSGAQGTLDLMKQLRPIAYWNNSTDVMVMDIVTGDTHLVDMTQEDAEGLYNDLVASTFATAVQTENADEVDESISLMVDTIRQMGTADSMFEILEACRPSADSDSEEQSDMRKLLSRHDDCVQNALVSMAQAYYDAEGSDVDVGEIVRTGRTAAEQAAGFFASSALPGLAASYMTQMGIGAEGQAANAYYREQVELNNAYKNQYYNNMYAAFNNDDDAEAMTFALAMNRAYADKSSIVNNMGSGYGKSLGVMDRSWMVSHGGLSDRNHQIAEQNEALDRQKGGKNYVLPEDRIIVEDTRTQTEKEMDVLAEIEETISYALDLYEMFKDTAYFGTQGSVAKGDKSLSHFFGDSTSAVYNDYGCSGHKVWGGGDIVGALTDFETPMTFWAINACDNSAGTGGASLAGIYFSEVLGGYEAYNLYVPPKYCDLVWYGAKDAEGGKEEFMGSALSKQMMEYVFMLHGWGGHCDFLDGLAVVLIHVFTSCLDTANTKGDGEAWDWGVCPTGDDGETPAITTAPNGFLVMAPEDGSTPMGGKTFFADSVFIGRHMTSIVFEVPFVMARTMGIPPRASGLFGFSQGGIGSMRIAMAHPEWWTAVGVFNGPLMPAECLFNHACHMECGIDFALCELLWISTGVAFFPFVTLAESAEMSSSSDYDPMASGICFTVWYDSAYSSDVACTGGDWQYTWTGGTGSLEMDENFDGVEMCVLNADGSQGTCGGDAIDILTGGNEGNVGFTLHQLVTYHYVTYEWQTSGTFYLQPKLFTRVVNHFVPSHNAVTSEPDEDQFFIFLASSPFWELFQYTDDSCDGYCDADSDSGAFSSYAQYLLISVDENDQFNQYPQTTAFSALVFSGYAGTFKGLWAYDVPAIGMKHSYDLHDLILTIEWFSEAFRTWTRNHDADSVDITITTEYMSDEQAQKFAEGKTMSAKPSDWMGISVPYNEDLIDGGEMLEEFGQVAVCYLNEINVFSNDFWGNVQSEALEFPSDPMNPACQNMFGAVKYSDKTMGGRQTVRAQIEALPDAVVRMVNSTLSHAEAHGDLEQYQDNVHYSALYGCYFGKVLMPLVSGYDKGGEFTDLTFNLKSPKGKGKEWINTVCEAEWTKIENGDCDVCMDPDELEDHWAPTAPTADIDESSTSAPTSFFGQYGW